MIFDSKKQESKIIGHYKRLLAQMATGDSTRIASRKGYLKAKAEIPELRKIISKYRDRVPVTEKSKTYLADTRGDSNNYYNRSVGNIGPDYSKLTQYERDELYGALDKLFGSSKTEGVLRTVIGYEIANGLRGLNGRRATEGRGNEIDVSKKLVSNLGLSKDIANAYARVPSPKDVSAVYRDENGNI